jgi:hypothetical protein
VFLEEKVSVDIERGILLVVEDIKMIRSKIQFVRWGTVRSGRRTSDLCAISGVFFVKVVVAGGRVKVRSCMSDRSCMRGRSCTLWRKQRGFSQGRRGIMRGWSVVLSRKGVRQILLRKKIRRVPRARQPSIPYIEGRTTRGFSYSLQSKLHMSIRKLEKA